MRGLQIIAAAALFASCMVGTAGESISERVDDLASRLEVLNKLGGKCLTDLQRDGVKGEKAEACIMYFGKIRSHYGASIESDCAELEKWARTKLKYAAQHSNFIEQKPVEAIALMKDLNAYNKVCEPDIAFKQYPHIREAIDLLEAMKEHELAQ